MKNKFFYGKLALYGVFGAMLGANDIKVMETPLLFFAFLFVVFGIEILGKLEEETK